MPEKNIILSQVEVFDSNQLAQYVIEGIVTIEEIQETGDIERSKIVSIKNTIEEIRIRKKREDEEKDKEDRDSYHQVSSSNNIALIENWIAHNPNNNYLTEAENLLSYLKNKLELENQRKIEIIENIRTKPNKYSISELREFLKKGEISEEELLYHLPKKVVEFIISSKNVYNELKFGETPEYIPDNFTEVYFWGMPGSGKTCALGAVLSAADEKGWLEIIEGKGRSYANQLSNIFNPNSTELDLLPPPTNTEVTQYLPFKLLVEKKTRIVSMVELSGEVFKCFDYKISNIPFPAATLKQTFENVENLLRSENRKIHFFFIDYDKGNKTDEQNLKPSNYLSSAALYFQSNNIFKKYTDGIYIVVTKSDLIKDENGNECSYDEKIENSKKFLESSGYKSFITTLKSKCHDHGINGGELKFIPFSLGKVHFRELCEFNSTSAIELLNILIDKIPAERRSYFGFLNS